MFDLHTRRFAPTPLHPTELEQKSARESLRSWAFLPSVRRKPEWELSSGRRQRTPTLVIVSDSPIAGQSKIERPQISSNGLYAAGRKSKAGCRSQLGQLQQLAIADPGLREFGFRLARRLGIAPRLIQFGEPIIGPAVIRRTRKGAPKRHSFSPVAPRSAPQPSGSCCSLWRWQASRACGRGGNPDRSIRRPTLRSSGRHSPTRVLHLRTCARHWRSTTRARLRTLLYRR